MNVMVKRVVSSFLRRADADIEKLIPKILPRIQKVYDEWDENEDEYAGGGVCHDVAEEIAGFLDESSIEASTVSQSIGDVHVYVVAKTPKGVFRVDVNPHIYESGAAYTWKKKPDVKFDKGDVEIEMLDDDSSKYEEYIEE